MSGKHKRDYKKVFKAIKKLLPTSNVKTVTLDFEAAMWHATSKVFPNVKILGCFFHWSQAVWQKVQELGLQTAYNSDDKTHKYICKLLSLAYLPPEHIGPIFEKLQQKAATQPLLDLTNYIATTWLQNPLWPTSAWSVFGCVIQTNNDVERWHLCLNQKAKKGQLPFYLLVTLLHKEATGINIQVWLVLENKLTH